MGLLSSDSGHNSTTTTNKQTATGHSGAVATRDWCSMLMIMRMMRRMTGLVKGNGSHLSLFRSVLSKTSTVPLQCAVDSRCSCHCHTPCVPKSQSIYARRTRSQRHGTEGNSLGDAHRPAFHPTRSSHLLCGGREIGDTTHHGPHRNHTSTTIGRRGPVTSGQVRREGENLGLHACMNDACAHGTDVHAAVQKCRATWRAVLRSNQTVISPRTQMQL